MLCRKPREVAEIWGSCKKYWLTPKYGEKLVTTASVCYGKRTYKGESTNGAGQGKGWNKNKNLALQEASEDIILLSAKGKRAKLQMLNDGLSQFGGERCFLSS